MKALDHITILDLSPVPPGDLCTMILADFGANVIKIEGPPRPGAFHSPVGKKGEKEAAYRAFNRNKKAILLNLRTEKGREVFYRLVKKADVVVEGYRPGVSQRLGADYDTVKQINPKIIYCSLSGYGQEGPYQFLPGHDINYIATAGILDLIKDRQSNHVVPLNLLADFGGAALHGAIGILIALAARERSGKGQRVDVSYTDTVMTLLTDLASTYFFSGSTSLRTMPLEALRCGELPYYNVYETKDRKYLSVGCIEPHFYQNLCQALGRPDLVPYQHGPLEKQRETVAIFKEIFASKDRDEWFELLNSANVCVSKVNAIDEITSDPQLAQRKMVIDVDHPDFGKVKQIGIAIKLSDTPGEVRSTAPTLGKDTRAVLQSLGYTEQEIAEMVKAEVTKLDFE